MAPTGARDTPPTIFLTATGGGKTPPRSAKAPGTRGLNRPKHWRMPIPRRISTAAPIKISRVWRGFIRGAPELVRLAEEIEARSETLPDRDHRSLSVTIERG